MDTVIFDMDGVLINSKPIIVKAATKALADVGIDATADFFEPFIGAGEELFITEPCKNAGIEDKIESALQAMYQNYHDAVYQELAIFPYAAEIIQQLHRAGYTLALVSSSAKEKLLLSLDAARIPADCFDLILSGSDVEKKKPHPAPYQKAAARLDKLPADCLVIEDALNGIASAKAAGMTCAAVTTSFSKEQLEKAGADVILSNLSEIPRILTKRR